MEKIKLAKKSKSINKFFKGLIGIYALICFWSPVFWYTSYLMNKYDMWQFSFSNLMTLEKILYPLIFFLSISTTLIIFNELKDEK